jgi:uncharacterized protein (DUF2236 family)
MDLRRRIVAEFEKGAGRHDDPVVYGGRPGDPGLIGPDSVSWEINADLAAVSQAGLPAIVLEILHRPSSQACRICPTTVTIRSSAPAPPSATC